MRRAVLPPLVLVLVLALGYAAAASADEQWEKIPDDSPGSRVKLGPLSVTLPGGAQWFVDDEARVIRVHLSLYHTGSARIRDEAMPASQEAAVKEWTRVSGEPLGAGTAEHGTYWAVTRHEIRVPMPVDPRGIQKSRLDHVTLVQAVAPLTAGQTAECTFRLEAGGESMEDEGVQQALAICTSMATAVAR